MYLASMLTIALAFPVGACGTTKKTTGGGGASSTSYYSVSGNICSLVTPSDPFTAAQLETINSEAEEGSGELKAGVCPSTVTIGTVKALVLKTCDSKEEEVSPGITADTQATVYNQKESDGQIITVTAAQATEVCEQIANPASDEKSDPTH